MMSSLCILIVEDDKEVASHLQLYLSPKFSRVDIAFDGKEAFEKYLNYDYDLIISDIEMPYDNGITLFQKIRKLDTDILLILFSGHTQEKYLLEMVTLKLDGYLMKPITSKKIDEILEKVLACKEAVKVICKEHDIAYSYLSKIITCKEKSVSLTHFEIIVMELFLKQKAYKVTHEMLSEALYDDEEKNVKDRTKNLIKRLRQKLPFLKIAPLVHFGYQLMCTEYNDG